MRLKSIIEKIMLVNEAVNYSESTENIIYNEYLPEDNFQAQKELEEIFNNSKECTQNDELKLGLEIILTLISHKNENIKASALGKIYFLADNKHIQKTIIKELKNMSYHRNKDFSNSAQHSIDLIALEVHKLRIFEIFFKILTELWHKIDFKVDKYKFSSIMPFYSDKTFSKNTSKIRNKNEIFYPNNSFNSVLRIFRVFNRRIDRMFPYFEEIESIYHENLNENEIMSFYNAHKLEFSKEDSLQKLATFYSQTFRERGHLRRLIALLDDEDPSVQQMGVNALTDVVKVLLTNSNQKKFIKSYSSSNLDKSLKIT